MQDPTGTVYIVEDDEQVRDFLTKLVESIGLVPQPFARAEDLLKQRALKTPSCVLLDLRMPGISGLQVQKQLKTRGDSSPIIFLSGHAETETVAEAFRNGAFDFLEKPIKQQTLLDRVQAALAKHSELARRASQREEAQARVNRLSAREREVLALLVEGLSSKVIAARLQLSKKTVDLHRSSILKKLEATSTADVVRMALASQVDRDQYLGATD